MTKMLLQHVDHPHPRVRYTALHAIGQLANDQAPTFQAGASALLVTSRHAPQQSPPGIHHRNRGARCPLVDRQNRFHRQPRLQIGGLGSLKPRDCLDLEVIGEAMRTPFAAVA